MKPIRWMMMVFAGALSIAALSNGAVAQVPFQELPKSFTASVPRDVQISIALSAAPAAVASKATVYVLGPKGYEVAREGTNGVSCIVGRDFANPDETTIEPMCCDAEGSRTLLRERLYMEELRTEGKSEAEIKADIANGYKDGRFKPPSKPGVLYMLSTDNRLGPTPGGGTANFPPHLMFYAPYMTGKDLGYDSTAPFLVEPGQPDAMMVVVPQMAPKPRQDKPAGN